MTVSTPSRRTRCPSSCPPRGWRRSSACPEVLVEDLRRAGLPVSRNVSTGEWSCPAQTSWGLEAVRQPAEGTGAAACTWLVAVVHAGLTLSTDVDRIGSASSRARALGRRLPGSGLSRLGPRQPPLWRD